MGPLVRRVRVGVAGVMMVKTIALNSWFNLCWVLTPLVLIPLVLAPFNLLVLEFIQLPPFSWVVLQRVVSSRGLLTIENQIPGISSEFQYPQSQGTV